VKLNIGCGYKKKKGWVNLDKFEELKPDVVHNLNNAPYPFEDCQFTEILADNVLEHVEDIITCMNELHRIMKPGGILEIIVPKFPSFGAIVDPTHIRFFIEETFFYFIDANKSPGTKPWRFHKNNAMIAYAETYSANEDKTVLMKVKLQKPEEKNDQRTKS